MGGMYYRFLEQSMKDSEVPDFYRRATGREYHSDLNISVNDIRRICVTFWNEELARRLEYKPKEVE